MLLSQYADDIFLTLDGSEQSLDETLKCFNKFSPISGFGLKMNSSKTRAVWIGLKKYSDQVFCPDFKLLWSHANFKLLGMDFPLT